MDTAFTFSNYVIKPQGLSIGGKYRVFDQQNNPVLFVEYKTKWSKPFIAYHVYADERKQRELLLIQDAEVDESGNCLDIIDVAGGGKIGGIDADWKNWFEDAWKVLDAQGVVAGLLREKSTGRAILHEMTEGLLPQIIHIVAGDQPVAELRQKNAFLGHSLLADFSMDTASRLDRRLGLAAAIVVAVHQAATDSV